MSKKVKFYFDYLYYHKGLNISRLFIWSTLTAFLFLVIWGTIGEVEDVVKTNGQLRPQTNVSLIRSPVSGIVKHILYEEGIIVKQGDPLIQINSGQLDEQLSEIENEIVALNRKLKTNQTILEKILQSERNISNDPEIQSALKAYFAQLDQLNYSFLLSTSKWESEANKPSGLTTTRLISELKLNSNIDKQRYDTFKNSYEKDLRTQIVFLEDNLQKLDSQKKQIESLLRQYKIIAPISGKISEIAKLNSGDYINQNQDIIKIVPEEGIKLFAELLVDSTHIGRLKEGMTVRIHLVSFPFQEFGSLSGVLTQISPDASVDRNGKIFFQVRCSINSDTIENRFGKKFPIKVGYMVEGIIVLDKLSPLQYFLRTMNIETKKIF